MTLTMKGAYDIEALDINTGRLVWKKHIDNLLMPINQSSRAALLLGSTRAADAGIAITVDDLEIKYFAFGTGTAAPSSSDTQLANEIYRKQVTQISYPQADTVSSAVSLGTSEVTTTITEIGIFCGSAATSEANSGTLLSRVLVNIPHNSNIVLNIYRTDTCTIGG